MGEEPRFNMRTNLIVWGATVALLLGSAVSGEAAKYTFTKIADTSGDFRDLNYAAINDEGTVAFWAADDVDIGGKPAIYTSDGSTPSVVADTSGDFFRFSGFPSINNKGVVAFRADLKSGGQGISSSDGTTFADFPSFLQVRDPSMNDGGTVAFYGRTRDPITRMLLSGIYKADGTTTETVADTNTDGPYGKFGDFDVTPSINDRNIVAYRASDRLGVGIFTDELATPTEIAHTSEPDFSLLGSPLINNKDAVAFLANNGSGVFMDNGTGPTLVSDNSKFGGFVALSVNDEGGVAFLATYNGARGIFTGPDPDADKVIAVGDFDLGPKVIGLCDACFGREGLNNAGQLVFVVDLEGGTRAIYRADPDPVASDIEVVVDIKPGGNPNMINMESKGKVPVAILTTDDFDAWAVDLKTVALAGTPVVMKKNGSIMAAFEDVDGDSDLDLVFHVETQALVQNLAQAFALNEGETEATLQVGGLTLDGKVFKGSDSVVVH